MPGAGAWPRTSGSPFADWRSAAVTPPQATPPAPGQGLGKRRVTSLYREGFWMLPGLGPGSGARRLRGQGGRVPSRHAPARSPWFQQLPQWTPEVQGDVSASRLVPASRLLSQ